eukprot:62584-Prorocentrum_minimum.AAC.1
MPPLGSPGPFFATQREAGGLPSEAGGSDSAEKCSVVGVSVCSVDPRIGAAKGESPEVRPSLGRELGLTVDSDAGGASDPAGSAPLPDMTSMVDMVAAEVSVSDLPNQVSPVEKGATVDEPARGVGEVNKPPSVAEPAADLWGFKKMSLWDDLDDAVV